ncbi:MAG: ATP/GTP-binding protein [Deltaproteobacteria bacterium]|nr:ATP/GTP-binding protein [Deltaproteobacteria bacterium]
MASLQEQFESALVTVTLPHSGQALTETEIVHSCLVSEDFAKFTLVLPEDSPLRGVLPAQIEQAILPLGVIKRVIVDIVSERPDDSEENVPPQAAPQRPVQQPKRTAYLQNYDAVIAVASGKGGVGKSTVSINLALALQQQGLTVGLFDADIYGPSLPIMTGLRAQKPEVFQNKLKPIEAHGVHTMSIGNLVDEDSAMIWRGPMVHQAIEQMLRDTAWPGGDVLVLDLPPGTGDAQLTLSQLCEITGAVIVSTPQDVALLDATKAVSMFGKVDIPILGIVENMSVFVCPKCGTATPIFSEHGAKQTSQKLGVPFLGAIPIELAVRQGGDAGTPVMSQGLDSPATQAFHAIAENVVNSLETLG